MPSTVTPSAGTTGSRRTAPPIAKGKIAGVGVERGVASTNNKFPKAKRLLKHADFQRVYQSGRRQFTGNMTVFYLRRDRAAEDVTGEGNQPRVGFTVGKVLGGSVERNRIRRRMREAVRTLWQQVEGPVDVVFNPRRSVSELPFAALISEVERGLRLAMQRARVPPAAGEG